METKIDYLALNYPFELIRDIEQGGFFANHPDLPGCAAQGETADEAIANLDDARKLWIETRLADNLPIPVPLSDEPSGKLLLRMTRSLHAELAKHAVRQGVSLNLLINTILAEYLGGAAYRSEMPHCRQVLDSVRTAFNRAIVRTKEEYPDAAPWYWVNDDPKNRFKESIVLTTFSTRGAIKPLQQESPLGCKLLWEQMEK